MNARKSLESKRVTNERSSALLTNSTLQSNIQANDSQKVLENPERTIQAIDRRTKKATEVNNELRCLVMCGDPNTSLIASILWYYQTYSELREKINADPSENIVDYLVDLDRLDDIVKCFKSIKILDEEKRVIELYNTGRQKLIEASDKAILCHTHLISPNDLIDLCKLTSPPPIDPESSHVFDLGTFRIIFEWFLEHGLQQGLINSYASKRSAMIRDSLQSLAKNLQNKCMRRNSATLLTNNYRTTARRASVSLGSLGDTLKTTLTGIRHLTPSPITNRRKSICKSMLLEPDVTPNQNLSVNNSSSPRPFSSDQETNNYKTLLDALYVLLLHDFDLLFYVFSDEYKALILPKLVKSPLHYMQQEAQRLCTDIQQLSHKIDTEKFAFYGLFSIIRWFHKSENMFNKIYDENFLAPEHHFEIILSAIFENSIVACLNAILGEVQNDSSPLSQRRSVHPLMLNVLSFMEGLFEYRDVISHKRFSRSPNIVDSSSEEKYLFNLENFFSDLIKNLLENIMKKMNTLIPYNERMGRTIFLLNNTNYLLKQLESSPLLVMIENKQPNIRAQLKETVQKCVQTYRKCYTPFTMTIREMLNNPSVKHFSDNPLKEGDREVLKASFTKVNEIIDTLRNQNQQYTVDDAHQRHYLRTESKKKVLEPFKTYYNQFAHIDFTQNSEKYKRYNPPMLESIIDSFFEH
ncbi:unnamed protein product [Rotaria magnacalcarata]|uniref:Exocyst complex component 7 n=1 Tax=Rotaria magnacalcarata TaxID=392030 RepID=A0A816ZMB4_9BILA|nr:unnamed protein product [Rotaria magnacalcarata]